MGCQSLCGTFGWRRVPLTFRFIYCIWTINFSSAFNSNFIHFNTGVTLSIFIIYYLTIWSYFLIVFLQCLIFTLAITIDLFDSFEILQWCCCSIFVHYTFFWKRKGFLIVSWIFHLWRQSGLFKLIKRRISI